MPILNIENLVVSYYGKEILYGANLNLMPGEIVSLIGANGAGKSTLLMAIAGVIRSTSGTVLFDGQIITNRESHEIVMRGIGFLMQGGAVFPGLTVSEHLRLATEKMNKKTAGQGFDEAISLFPLLGKMRNKRAGVLSGGERQMLLLATVLVRGPKLLLLDEPSGGLAPITRKYIFDLIKRLTTEKGVAVLVVEQNIVEVVRISDRVFIVKNGRTYVEERPDVILSGGNVEEIFFK